MMNALRSGVSGIRSHQTRMDVIGNNIANVNTAGFKRSRVTFHELLGQQKLGIGRQSGGSGINPTVVGLGVGVGSIDQDWSQGSLENTNIATDLALVGDGFFIASDGRRNMLTRAGNFTFNAGGELTSATGLNIQGWSYDAAGNLDMSQLRNVKVEALNQNATQPKFTENIGVSGNLSADASAGEVITVSTPIYDEQGKPHQTLIQFTKTANANEWTYDVQYPGTSTPVPFADVTGTVTFDVNGALSTVDGAAVPPAPITLTWDAGYVGSAANFTVDLMQMTQYSGSTTMTVNNQDGYSAGQFLGYSIGSDGLVSLNYSNGEQSPVFQIALANVPNPNGLQQLGENMYDVTTASGDLSLGRPGKEFQTHLVPGALELGNVDLTTEFTDMIVTQRGFQASARVITTSDELLQEIVQLKR